MDLTPEQKKVIEATGSCTVLGAPGTGKTLVLIEKAAQLLKQGTKAEDICFVVFSYRAMLVLKHELVQRFGENTANAMQLGTLLDLPLHAIQLREKDLPEVADNTYVRRLLRQAMWETNFPGHLNEAEHIMRTFKSKGRKPAENEPNYELFHAYKNLLENSGMFDRHDLVRKHIIGMRNDMYEPFRAHTMLVDNIQDATQIQLLWLADHMKAGVRLIAAGCDDSCLFGLDGALGASAFTDLEELNDIPRITLTHNFRMAQAVAQAAEAVVKPLKGRLPKGDAVYDNQDGVVEITIGRSADHELELMVAAVQQALQAKPGQRIGIITRHDLLNRRVERALRRADIAFTSFARSIWESAGPLMVLDLLEVLLNRSNDSKLKNVLAGYGVPPQWVEAMFTRGLVADEWLKHGAPLPADIELDIPTGPLREIGLVQRRLLGYYRLMREAGPKEVFKAATYDLMQKMREDDRNDALHALDELLSLKGNLVQALDTIRDKPDPDPDARVIVAPVREVRNMQFDYVFLPFITVRNYPLPYKVLGTHERADRRLLYVAMTRARQRITLSHSGEASPFLADIAAFAQSHAA